MSTNENLTMGKYSIQEIENAIETKNTSILTAIVKQEMLNDGFCHIPCKMPTELFEKIAHQLGKLLTNTSIRVDKQSEKKAIEARAYRSKNRPITYSANGINFHSDSPIQKVIGFYCVQQDRIDGTSLMLDLQAVQNHMSEKDISILRTIKVNWGSLVDGKEVINKAPLIEQKDGAIEFYYAPWHLQENINSDQQEVLDRFQDFIEHLQKHHLLRIRLQEGEILFVNNRRMLHSREKIADDSQRHIIRLGIGEAN